MQESSKLQQTTLDNLLEQIRLRGIPVSNIELQRLQNVFASTPQLSRVELRNLLACLLAKDNKQRQTINYLFDQLIPYELEDKPVHSTSNSTFRRSASRFSHNEVLDQEEISQQEIKKRKPMNFWYFGLAMAFLLISAVIFTKVYDNQQQEKIGKIELPEAQQTPISSAPQKIEEDQHHDLKLIKTITLWTPEIISVEPIPIWRNSLPALLLFLGSGLGFAWLLQQALQRSRKRIPSNIVIHKKGRAWQPPLKKLSQYHLLSSHARREMAWGIRHYLSAQPLNKLDIPRTVTASAKSGLPSLHFYSAQREREVWLWQDRSSSNPDLNKLAIEIQTTLQAVNIHLQQGYFQALPHKISNQHNEVIWSTRHEYPENQPLVIVLCDMDSLDRMGALRSEQGHHTLQQLSHWQNLAIVDCSNHAGELCQQLASFKLHCLAPQEVASWLTQQSEIQKTPDPECKLDDLHRWAIACSLPDRPLMEAEIRALHEALQLDCAWQYHKLKDYTQVAGKGLDFSPYRHSLLQDFSQLAGSGSQENTDFIECTLKFWHQRYNEIEQLCSEQEIPRFPWKNSREHYKLVLEKALLQLWQAEKINQAVETLYDLHQDTGTFNISQEVENRLGEYSCQNWHETLDNNKQILMPFDWNSLDTSTQQQLKACGFGGAAQQVNIAWDKKTGALLALLAGISLVGLYFSVQSLFPLLQPQEAVVQIVDNSAIPAEYLQKLTEEEGGKYFTIGHRKTGEFKSVEAPDNYQVNVRWEKQTVQPAQMKVAEYRDTEIWRLGEDINPERLKNKSDISIAVIQASPKKHITKLLATKLLDMTKADIVIIGRHWQKTQKKLQESIGKSLNHHWLFINMPKSALDINGEVIWSQYSPRHYLQNLDKSKNYALLESKLDLSENRSLQSIKKFQKQPKVAISVGISTYNQLNGFPSISYAANDAKMLSDTLQKKGYHSTLLLNNNATKLAVLHRIAQFGKLFKPGEGVLIFSFSGYSYSEGGISYLVTYDTQKKKLVHTSLSLQNIVNAIQKTGVRNAILLIDARNNPTSSRRNRITTKPEIKLSSGIHILYGSRDIGWESSSIGNGVFSYFLNKALNGSGSKNGIITFDTLIKYVVRVVPRWTNKNLNKMQRPFHQGSIGNALKEIVITIPHKIALTDSYGRILSDNRVSEKKPLSNCIKIKKEAKQAYIDKNIFFLKRIHNAIKTTNCSSPQKRYVERQLAYLMYNKLVKKKPTEEAIVVGMREILKINNLFWPALLSLGDYFHDKRHFEKSEKYYSETVFAISNKEATPKSDYPSQSILSRIIKYRELDLLAKGKHNNQYRGGGDISIFKVGNRKLKKVLIPIHFDFSRNTLVGDDLFYARRLYKNLLKEREPNITIIAHTDPIGSSEMNRKLSSARAKIISRFLKNKGYKGRIITIGKGENVPIYDPRNNLKKHYGKKRWYRMLRRVEVRLNDIEQQSKKITPKKKEQNSTIVTTNKKDKDKLNNIKKRVLLFLPHIKKKSQCKGRITIKEIGAIKEFLHKAVSTGSNKAVIRCLKLGTAIELRDNNQWTPLHMASYHGQYRIVTYLLSKGASINAKTVNKQTPLDLAIIGKHKSISDLLRKKGGRSK